MTPLLYFGTALVFYIIILSLALFSISYEKYINGKIKELDITIAATISFPIIISAAWPLFVIILAIAPIAFLFYKFVLVNAHELMCKHIHPIIKKISEESKGSD